MKFLHRIIPFLSLFCNCQRRRLDSIQFLCSQAHVLAGGVSQLYNTSLNDLNWTLLYNNFSRTTQITQPLYSWEGVFTAPLHSNGSYSVVACVFVASKMCLPSCWLAMNVYSDFIIQAFGRHVTISYHIRRCKIKIYDKETLVKPFSDHSISQGAVPDCSSGDDLHFFGRYSVRVSAGTNVMQTGFQWICLNLLDNCQRSASIILRRLPSRLFQIHYSSDILPLDAVILYRYWLRRKIKDQRTNNV
jgi:hypothetical protein